MSVEYSREHLIDALIAAYRHLKEDGGWNTDETYEQHVEKLNKSSMDELIEGTCPDKEFTLDEFFYAYT